MARILVVDDSPTNRLLTRELLTAHGHEVVEAGDGHVGVEVARSVVPELILLDLQLPDIDGFDVARLLRDDPRLDDVPVIALTAFSHEPVRERALASGCDGYVTKPIRYRVLLDEMENALARRRAR